MKKAGAIARVAIPMIVLCGCAANRGTAPYQAQPESARDSLKAQRLTQEAAENISKNPAKAEALLREALTADVFHGPAHNNLGAIYLQQGLLYQAAQEFEWAGKLMPGHPDPRVNLAATLERAGRTEEALASYGAALDASPGYIAAAQGLTRLQLKCRRTDQRTRSLLEEVALRGESDRWRQWARQELALITR